MEHSVIIKSAHEGTALEFFDYAADYYKVSVRGFSFHGAERVYAYEPFDLATFFHDLAAHLVPFHDAAYRSWAIGVYCLAG